MGQPRRGCNAVNSRPRSKKPLGVSRREWVPDSSAHFTTKTPPRPRTALPFRTSRRMARRPTPAVNRRRARSSRPRQRMKAARAALEPPNVQGGPCKTPPWSQLRYQFHRRPEPAAEGNEDHGGVPVAVAVAPGSVAAPRSPVALRNSRGDTPELQYRWARVRRLTAARDACQHSNSRGQPSGLFTALL